MQMPKSGHRSWFSSQRKVKNEGCSQTIFSRCQTYHTHEWMICSTWPRGRQEVFRLELTWIRTKSACPVDGHLPGSRCEKVAIGRGFLPNENWKTRAVHKPKTFELTITWAITLWRPYYVRDRNCQRHDFDRDDDMLVDEYGSRVNNRPTDHVMSENFLQQTHQTHELVEFVMILPLLR